jgi:hypothetical protein
MPLAITIRTACDVVIRKIRIHNEVYVVVKRVADATGRDIWCGAADGRDGGGQSVVAVLVSAGGDSVKGTLLTVAM